MSINILYMTPIPDFYEIHLGSNPNPNANANPNPKLIVIVK